MSHRRAARTCRISRSVQSVDTVTGRNGRLDDLLDHHPIVVLLTVGQFIIGDEERMGVATLCYLAGEWTQSKSKGRWRDSIIGARAAGHARC